MYSLLILPSYKNSLAHLSTDKVITTGEPDAIEKKRNSQDVTHDETSAVDNKRKRDEEEKEEGERYKELKTDVGSSGLEQETIPRPTEI